MTRHRLGLAILLGVGAIGCATADIPATVRGSEQVQIRKGDPPDSYKEVGPVSATNGSGCGGFGARGTHEGAMAELKNQAVRLRADYVRLDVAVEPHPAPGCFVNEYALRGVAFRRGTASPVLAAKPPAAPSPAELQLAGRSDQDRLQVMGEFVGQKVVLHLKTGEVVAATLAAVTPPDSVKLVLLDQSARGLRAGEIDRVRLSP